MLLLFFFMHQHFSTALTQALLYSNMEAGREKEKDSHVTHVFKFHSLATPTLHLLLVSRSIFLIPIHFYSDSLFFIIARATGYSSCGP